MTASLLLRCGPECEKMRDNNTMSLTLLVEKKSKLTDLHAVNLHIYVGTEIIHKETLDEAMEVVKVVPNVDLIVVESTKEDQAATKLSEKLSAAGKKISMIVIGEGDPMPGDVRFVSMSTDIRSLVRNAAEILGITAKDMASKVVPEYFPIPINHFKNISTPMCDVYAKLEDGYKIVCPAKGSMAMKTVDQLVGNGATHLFVPQQFRLKVVNQASDQLIADLENKNASVDQKMDAISRGMSFVHEEILIKGFSDTTRNLAAKCIKGIESTVRDNKPLSRLLTNLLSKTYSYQYKHCQALTYVAFHIIENMSWGSEEQQQKLGFVAFYHDIALITDEKAMIENEKELLNSSLCLQEKSIVEKHAMAAASMVAEFDHTPIGADALIRQHHGQMNGVGFAKNYSGQISPLAIVFIVAESFVHGVLKNTTVKINK